MIMIERLYVTYAPDTDITFIMVDMVDENDEIKSTEVVGWYYGEPDTDATMFYYGKTKAEY